MVNGKQKGSAFERQICKALSEWLTHGKKVDCFWRSAMSGGRATVARKSGVAIRQSGDISAVSQEGHALTDKYYIECKSYRDLNFVGLLKRKGKLAEFWLETRKQADHYKKLPMLIAKQNQQPVILCLSQEGQLALRLKAHVLVPSMGLRIVLFDSFLKMAMRPQNVPTR